MRRSMLAAVSVTALIGTTFALMVATESAAGAQTFTTPSSNAVHRRRAGRGQQRHDHCCRRPGWDRRRAGRPGSAGRGRDRDGHRDRPSVRAARRMGRLCRQRCADGRREHQRRRWRRFRGRHAHRLLHRRGARRRRGRRRWRGRRHRRRAWRRRRRGRALRRGSGRDAARGASLRARWWERCRRCRWRRRWRHHHRRRGRRAHRWHRWDRKRRPVVQRPARDDLARRAALRRRGRRRVPKPVRTRAVPVAADSSPAVAVAEPRRWRSPRPVAGEAAAAAS